MIYLDSSALFKRYCQETGTGAIQQLFGATETLATVALPFAEIFSALTGALAGTGTLHTALNNRLLRRYGFLMPSDLAAS